MPWILPNSFTIPSWATAQQQAPAFGPAPTYGGYQPALPISQQVVSPLFGRPGWTYIKVQPSPTQGPTPRLAQGTGLTGNPAHRQYGMIPGGYLTKNDYRPAGFDIQPPQDDRWLRRIPKSIGVGTDGVDLVGTYRAHDFTPAEYGTRQWRSASNWQEMAYPSGWRNTLAYQQVAKYNLYNAIQQAAPLPQANYFLGYQIQPGTATTLASAGGMGVL